MKQSLDFIVAGAQKCATTWLYQCLREHPSLCLPAKKREVEFIGGDLYAKNGPDWFFSLFRDYAPGKVMGDVSVEYLVDARSPRVLSQNSPDLKIIASLRDPIDRLISAYFWYQRKGMIDNLDIESGIELCFKYFPADDPGGTGKYYKDLITRGFYDVQLLRYLERFQPQKMMLILYEDIKKDPLPVIQNIFQFLGVEKEFIPQGINDQPKKNSYIEALVRIEKISKNNKFLIKLLDFVNNTFSKEKIHKHKPMLTDNSYERLGCLYRQHLIKMREITELLPKENLSSGFFSEDNWINRYAA